jgi:hypothetical protein
VVPRCCVVLLSTRQVLLPAEADGDDLTSSCSILYPSSLFKPIAFHILIINNIDYQQRFVAFSLSLSMKIE